MIKPVFVAFVFAFLLAPYASHSETLRLRVTGGEIVEDQTLQFSTKPIAKPIPLIPGTLIEVTVHPEQNVVLFEPIELRLYTDLYDKAGESDGRPKAKSTGPTDIRLSLHNFPFIEVDSNGDLGSGAQLGYWIQEWSELGGQGHILIHTQTGSKFVDDDLGGLDLTDGLGLKGKLVLKLLGGQFPRHIRIYIEAREIRKRDFEVLYDPPIVKVIFPGPLQPPHLSRRVNSRTFTVDELISAAAEVSGNRNLNRKSRALTFENVSDVQLLLLDDRGLVISGDISDSSEKTLTLPDRNRRNLRVLATPRLEYSETMPDVPVETTE